MINKIKAQIEAMPEIGDWPELISVVDRTIHLESRSAWEYPVRACMAVGGAAEEALPGAAAVFCAVSSIHLVDDMLDDDPGGDFHDLGAGSAANLALAFQGAAHRLLADAPLIAESAVEAQRWLAQMSLVTAWGQRLDAGGVEDEEGYWRVVEAKTPPLFRFALGIGALLGGAPLEIARRLAGLGSLMGMIVQINDDFGDAMQSPAASDWQRPGNNLPMLFALTAEHGEREEFARLCRHVSDPEALERGQRILFRSGAVSYCAFKMLELAEQARALLASLPLVRPKPLAELLDAQIEPLDRLLAAVGAGSSGVDSAAG